MSDRQRVKGNNLKTPTGKTYASCASALVLTVVYLHVKLEVNSFSFSEVATDKKMQFITKDRSEKIMIVIKIIKTKVRMFYTAFVRSVIDLHMELEKSKHNRKSKGNSCRSDKFFLPPIKSLSQNLPIGHLIETK